jgi:hypothetical protein
MISSIASRKYPLLNSSLPRSNPLHVLLHHTSILIRPVVDRIAIIMGLPRAKGIAPLPEEVARNPRGADRSRLPGNLDSTVVGRCAVFLEQARLSGRCAGCAVRFCPEVAPVV